MSQKLSAGVPVVRHLLKLQPRTKRGSDDKYVGTVHFRETDATALELQMLADRLRTTDVDVLARLVFRMGLSTLKAAIAAGLIEGVELTAVESQNSGKAADCEPNCVREDYA
jgi:hypothetical protein